MKSFNYRSYPSIEQLWIDAYSKYAKRQSQMALPLFFELETKIIKLAKKVPRQFIFRYLTRAWKTEKFLLPSGNLAAAS